jgi:cell division protein FtsQ
MERHAERDLTTYPPARSRPIIGHQKAAGFKRTRTFKEVMALGAKITAMVILLVFAVSSSFAFRDYLFRSPRFRIALKEIHGLHHLSESQILMKLRGIEEENKNLIALDLHQLRKSLESLAWVKTAMVRRLLPDKLVIQISERVPIAFARMNHSTLLVDDDAMLLETKGENLLGFDFPVLMGLESGFENDVLTRNRKRIALYKQLMRALDENGAGLSKDVSEIHLHDAGSVSVVLNEDTVLVHMGDEKFQERFRRYLAMSREIKQKYPLLDSVDLRFENQVVVNGANEKIASSHDHQEAGQAQRR